MTFVATDLTLSALQTRCAELEQRVAELTGVADRFVDNVSHEFRTPLTVIREYASILRDGLGGAVSESQRRHLDQIIDRGDDLALLVEDLLDLGKFQGGLFSARRKPCRAADIIGSLKPSLQRKAALKGITLEIDLGDGLPAMYCDADLVRRLWANLAANAFKFCEPGNRVHLWSRVASATEVVLGVSDDGPGIEADDASLIFEPFTQLDAPVRSSTKGLGLGLAVARQLATVNLGEIMLASEPGEGSTFSFTVPRATPLAILKSYLGMLSRELPQDRVSLIEVSIADTSAGRRAAAVDEFLHYVVSWNDLVCQSSRCGWRLLIAGDSAKATETIDKITVRWNEFRRSPATSTAPDLQMSFVADWSRNEALPALRSIFSASEQSQAVRDGLYSPSSSTHVLSTDLRQQQQLMLSSSTMIMAGTSTV